MGCFVPLRILQKVRSLVDEREVVRENDDREYEGNGDLIE